MSTYKLKVIKSKKFTVKGVDHTHYTAAYKGRVFGVSTMRFEGDEDELVYDDTDKTLTISCDIEVLKNQTVDALTGEVKQYLDIVPKAGLMLAEF